MGNKRGHLALLDTPTVKQTESKPMKPSYYNILVVDDEEPMRDLIVSLLSNMGHQSITASNGLEALHHMKGHRFDAVITDIVMPEMDGIALIRQLLQHDQSLPVMVITGHAEDYSAETAIASGAREFLSKPFSMNEFIIRFEKMMRDRRVEEALLALSLKDELTGLFNRRRFFILAEHSIKRSVRTKKRLMLLFIDMDDLKQINDRYGHHAGDRALIELANILKKTFRESDITARIGGDEFVVLSESVEGSIESVITRLNENIRDYNDESPQGYKLSISVGMAPFDPEHPVSIDELLSKADARMYAEKRKRDKYFHLK